MFSNFFRNSIQEKRAGKAADVATDAIKSMIEKVESDLHEAGFDETQIWAALASLPPSLYIHVLNRTPKFLHKVFHKTIKDQIDRAPQYLPGGPNGD